MILNEFFFSRYVNLFNWDKLMTMVKYNWTWSVIIYNFFLTPIFSPCLNATKNAGAFYQFYHKEALTHVP